METSCPPHSTSHVRFQRSTQLRQWLSDDWTLGHMTGRATAVSDCAYAQVTVPATWRTSQVTGRSTTWSPIESSKHPERNFHDRTRPLAHERTQRWVRSSLTQLHAIRQRTLTFIGRTPCVSVPLFLHRSITRPTAPFSALQLTGCRHRIQSLPEQRLVTEKQCLYFSHFATLDQMCQPPSVLLCARVLAYFSQTFSRVLALTII
jgi:hypothetical protein